MDVLRERGQEAAAVDTGGEPPGTVGRPSGGVRGEPSGDAREGA